MLATETLVIELLLVVSLVAIAVRRLRVPYTVALVIAGLLITFQQGIRVELTSELILALFVPPLVFEAAFHLGLDRLRANLVPILVLAVPGVLLTTAIVGLIVASGVGLPLMTALLFGALISATDPVAVVALFRTLNVPKRLTVLVEGESLLNDGTAIVVFNLVLATALPAALGATSTGSVNIVTAAVEFLRVSLIGAGLGLVLGWLFTQVVVRLDDYLIETTLTVVLAFGAYLVAERLGVSGVLAVVGAGIVAGDSHSRTMSPTTRMVLVNLWEYLAFVANSLVFLLIGLDVNLAQIIAGIGPITIAMAAVLFSRVVVVYGLTWLTNRISPPVPRAYQHAMFWGGLRGAIGLALVLGLPPTLPDRDLLRVMAYGVVLFTLLVQGTTMQLLLRQLGLTRTDDVVLEYERRHGRVVAARAAVEHLKGLQRRGVMSADTLELTAAIFEKQAEAFAAEQREHLTQHPHLDVNERLEARREAQRAGRAALASLLSAGTISDSVYEQLVTEIDSSLNGDADPPLA